MSIPAEGRSYTCSKSFKAGRENWVADESVAQCFKCFAEFSMMTWKYHCRSCGNVFCASCTSRTIEFTPHGREHEEGYVEKKKRVCESCFKHISEVRNKAEAFKSKVQDQVGGDSVKVKAGAQTLAAKPRSESQGAKGIAGKKAGAFPRKQDGSEDECFSDTSTKDTLRTTPHSPQCEPDSEFEPELEGVSGAYLIYEPLHYGTLSIVWSKSKIEGALAYAKPGKKVPEFKFAYNGKAELHREVLHDKQNYYVGWAQFLRTCNQFKCTVVEYGSADNYAPAPISLWMHHDDCRVQKVQPNKPFSTEGVDVIVATNRDSKECKELDAPNMKRDMFMEKARSIGHSFSLK